jgi:chromosome partitioning protein
MKTIAIALQKGGTGKTVLSVSLSASLALKAPGRVLLVDCDPQGNSSEWAAPQPIRAELAGVLSGTVPLRDALAKANFPGLSVLPSAGLGGELKAWGEGAGVRKPFAFLEVTKAAATLGFQYCVFDLSPGFGAVERAALVAADEVVTPIVPDPFGVSGLEIFTTNLKELRQDLNTQKPAYRRIVINAIDNRIKQHGEILESIQRSAEGFTVYRFPVDQVFRRAQTEQQSLFQTNSAKKETVAELERLTSDLMEG